MPSSFSNKTQIYNKLPVNLRLYTHVFYVVQSFSHDTGLDLSPLKIPNFGETIFTNTDNQMNLSY